MYHSFKHLSLSMNSMSSCVPDTLMWIVTYLIIADFTCQPRFLQSSLNSRRVIFHSVGVGNEFSVQVRSCRGSVLRDDKTLNVGGCSAANRTENEKVTFQHD